MNTEKRKPGRPKNNCKGGAPKNNLNAIRHGIYTGQLPRYCKDEEKTLAEYTTYLYAALKDVYGETLPINIVSTLGVIINAYRESLLAQRWLRLKIRELSIDERFKFSAKITDAEEKRHRFVLQLGLKQDAVPHKAPDNLGQFYT